MLSHRSLKCIVGAAFVDLDQACRGQGGQLHANVHSNGHPGSATTVQLRHVGTRADISQQSNSIDLAATASVA